MADQEAYQVAMREAANAAWDHDWKQAIQQYRAALNLVAHDPQATAGLALSLMEAGEYPEALSAYERVAQLVPGDPLPYEKMAQILAAMGQKTEAAKKHLAIGEMYFNRKDIPRAMPHWEEAVALDTNIAQAHMRLAVVYERDKATIPIAIYEYIELARLLQNYGQIPKAEQSLQRASKLDPLSTNIRDALDDLKKGQPIQRQKRVSAAVPEKAQASNVDEADDEYLLEEDMQTEARRSPTDEAARYGMAVLADLIWEEEMTQAAQASLLQAIDFQQIGDLEGAIEAYSQAAQGGVDHPALRLNLGLLYQAAHMNQDALNLLSQVQNEPEYALAANIAIGKGYLAEDDLMAANEHLIQALQAADHVLNTQYDSGGYERLLAGLPGQNQDQLTDMAKALSLCLEDENWRTRLGGAFTGYVAQGKRNYVPDLIELLIEGGKPEIAEIMERVDMFMARNILWLAMDEAHYALEKSPDYLPAHQKIADIMIQEGRAQEAAVKINLVANTYLHRGSPDKAADLFAEVLQLWPADVPARERVMEMLKGQGRVNEVLKHYQELGDLFYQLRADPDGAIRVYNEALAYAAANGADVAPRIGLLKSLADIESQRLNWREALSYYDKIVTLAPDDQDASRALIDLNFQIGQGERAIKALDNYMRYCVTNGHTDRIVTTLEEQVRSHPEEAALRQRLADVYRQQRRVPEAIAQLDALGELYLDAGRKADAAGAIRKIIALNPPDVDGYQQLLVQLEAPTEG